MYRAALFESTGGRQRPRNFVHVGDKCLNRVYHDGILPLAIAAAASDEKVSIA